MNFFDAKSLEFLQRTLLLLKGAISDKTRFIPKCDI